MKLLPGYYAIFESSQVPRARPLAVRLFGRDLVAWRDSAGAVVIQDARCPHRSASLAGGCVRGDSIVCPFHAFEYDAQGACRRIPEIGRGSERVRVRTWPTREAHGLIWIYWGPPGEAAHCPLPWFDNLAEGYVSGGFQVVWPTHFSRSVENQLDYAHLPYVHRTTIGRFVRAGAPPPEVLCADERIYWSTAGSETWIEFRFPNVWQNRISADVSLSLCFVPIDDGHTRLILRTHSRARAARLPLVGRLYLSMFNSLNRIILAQDRRVVLPQRPLDTAVADDEILVGSDQAIRHFRQQLDQRGWA